MSFLYQNLVKPVLFKYDPELVHDVLVQYANQLQKYPELMNFLHDYLVDETKWKPVTLWNITFPNRVGLAAGFDKNVQAPWFWWMLGFGHIEFGGVTEFG
ncbi:MAG: dihydroorotate dehydrogenase (quinone), partial [Bacteroidetes bacterium]|nr:dihydroorotate dehydrogenase (quinone) [Bacteroidota bacterium]